MKLGRNSPLENLQAPQRQSTLVLFPMTQAVAGYVQESLVSVLMRYVVGAPSHLSKDPGTELAQKEPRLSQTGGKGTGWAI